MSNNDFEVNKMHDNKSIVKGRENNVTKMYDS